MGERVGHRPGNKREPKILFQQYFKSSGTSAKTFASQVKETAGGDHILVLTEGRREEGSDELKKAWLMLFSEDFPAFFRMLHDTAQFIKDHPVPPEVKQRRQRFAGRDSGTGDANAPANEAAAIEAKRSSEPSSLRQRGSRRLTSSS